MTPNNIKIGIVGAGNMGAGITQKYASHGFHVSVIDVEAPSLQRAETTIQKNLEDAVSKNIILKDEKIAILKRITFETNLSQVSDADLVIEAIYENLGAKLELFKRLDLICSTKTILATNTSSFYVTDLSNATKREDRVLGLHYFFPPARNRLVEVIKARGTSASSFQTAWDIQILIQKIPIASKDAPGFIVNRFFVPWLNEAMRIVHEGIADIPTVESCAKQAFGVAMGPFELMNVTGVPIAYHAARGLEAQLGTFYAPCDLILPLLENGKKWDLTGEPKAEKFGYVGDRLRSVVFAIASQLVTVESVCSADDCDLGANIGLRWPKGPFAMMALVS